MAGAPPSPLPPRRGEGIDHDFEKPPKDGTQQHRKQNEPPCRQAVHATCGVFSPHLLAVPVHARLRLQCTQPRPSCPVRLQAAADRTPRSGFERGHHLRHLMVAAGARAAMPAVPRQPARKQAAEAGPTPSPAARPDRPTEPTGRPSSSRRSAGGTGEKVTIDDPDAGRTAVKGAVTWRISPDGSPSRSHTTLAKRWKAPGRRGRCRLPGLAHSCKKDPGSRPRRPPRGLLAARAARRPPRHPVHDRRRREALP